MLRKRVALLVAAAVMVLTMLATAASVFAQECSGASCEPSPGQTEKTRSPIAAPPQSKPGGFIRDPTASEKDPTSGQTGRGERISESSP